MILLIGIHVLGGGSKAKKGEAGLLLSSHLRIDYLMRGRAVKPMIKSGIGGP